jgi:serine/threonine protein kinase
LNRNPEDAELIALAAAVSDGAPVDWERAEREADNAEARLLVREMQRLAAIVVAHRSSGSAPENSSTAPNPPSAVRHWRHIVLFESIGAGAFGVVYRGWDPTLDRDVAVKLLPKETPGTASPLEEARHLARVRHSNIVTVYGADADGDQVGIWMEHIEGETLADMIRESGPMSAREATGVGIDLCRALAALHGADLLHRDIKAHNVMREVGGRIVLMDFSGAQALEHEVRNTALSGTPSYMAPELLDGAPASFASEVYSLGVLLFFLLSGRLPVEARTVEELKRAHGEARRNRLRDLRADVPDSMVRVIERAISPDVSMRHQTAGELEHALISASGAHINAGDEMRVPSPQADAQSWARSALWISIGLLIGATAAGTAIAARKRPPASPLLTRFTIGPPYTSGSWPRISPDGRTIVFGAIVEGRDRFWVRALDRVDGHPLMNTVATESPFWSPDGTWLCFFADGKLKRIPLSDGNAEAEILADAPHPHGGDWRGHSIIFARDDGIYKITLEGTAVTSRVTSLDQSLGDYQHSWPEFLPDGRRFLYVARSSRPERTGVYVASLNGDPPRLVMPAFSRVAYVDGHVLFVRQGTLVAQRFDATNATLEGEAVVLGDRIKYHASSDAAFDVSETGVLISGGSAGEPTTRLMLFDGRGRELEALTPVGHYRHPRFSPDGLRVVAETVNSDDQNVDIWLYDIARHSAARLTSTLAPDERPTWSPDGRRVVFSSKRGALYHVYTKAVDTTEVEQPLVTLPGDKFVEHWSHDGRYLSGTLLRSGLWIFPLDPKGKPWMLRADAKMENWQSEFSPDGRWLAYTSRESGNYEVYVEPFPTTGSRWQVSIHGGAQPHWRRGGRDLLYLNPNGMLMAATVTDGGWQKSSPLPLFHITVPDFAGSGDYSISPDGGRIVVSTFIADSVVPPIDVVVNWPALLAR